MRIVIAEAYVVLVKPLWRQSRAFVSYVSGR